MTVKDAEFINKGKKLYASYHLIYFIGLFRTLPVQDFTWEVGMGYSADLLVNILPMFLMQVMNNGDTMDTFTTV
jgi:hypothetical protein